MSELITLITLGIALSMDTFSLSLTLGMCHNSLKKDLIIAFCVGLFHFLMPFIGLKIGIEIFDHLNINFNLIIGSVLFILAFSMIKDCLKKETTKCEINLTYPSIIIFSLSVSFDSLVTGMGLLAITNNIILAALIFAIFSFIFTIIGLKIGKVAKKTLGNYSNIIGISLLLFLSITYLCK